MSRSLQGWVVPFTRTVGRPYGTCRNGKRAPRLRQGDSQPRLKRPCNHESTRREDHKTGNTGCELRSRGKPFERERGRQDDHYTVVNKDAR